MPGRRSPCSMTKADGLKRMQQYGRTSRRARHKRRRAGGDADKPRSGAFVLHVELKSRGGTPSPSVDPLRTSRGGVGITRAIGLDITGSAVAMSRRLSRAPFWAWARSRRSPRRFARRGPSSSSSMPSSAPCSSAISNAPGDPSHRPHRPYSRDLSVSGPNREGSFRSSCPPRIPEESPGALMDPSRRQRGGFGFSAPGESQLEIDRRLIGERITVRARARGPSSAPPRPPSQEQVARAVSAVALVGYTNAGKSTLFNRLTRSAVSPRTCCFHLDRPARGPLSHGRRVILSDTVGFISELPTMLIAASAPRWGGALRRSHPPCPRHPPPNSDAQAEDVGRC